MSIVASAFDVLLAETRPLSDRFAARGRSLFLVGGIVRDTLLGRVGGGGIDLDLTTDAAPDEIEEILRSASPTAVWTQGKRFGTIGANIVGPHGLRAVEITTNRAEEYAKDSRKPAVMFASSIDADLSRRDFTVNAIAVSTLDGSLIDPFGGVADLKARRLRTPVAAVNSFADDPLRMLRAARFLAAFDLVAVTEIVEAVERVRDRLSIVSRERVHAELIKLLLLPSPGRGLGFLHETTLLDSVVASLGTSGDTAAWLQRIDELTLDVTVRLAAVMLRPRPGAPREEPDVVAGAQRILRALRCSAAEIADMYNLLSARAALRAMLDADVTPSDGRLRRYVRARTGAGATATALVRWELAGPPADPARVDALDRLETQLGSLASTEDLDDLTSPLNGDEIMAHLDVPPGQVIGQAQAMLLDARLDDGPIDDGHARLLLDRWWAARRGDEQ